MTLLLAVGAFVVMLIIEFWRTRRRGGLDRSWRERYRERQPWE